MQSEETRTEHRFDRFENRLARVEARLLTFGERLSEVEVIVTGLEIRVAHVEVDVVETMSELKELRARLGDGVRPMCEQSAALRKRVFYPGAGYRESCDGYEESRREMRDGFQSLLEELGKLKILELIALGGVLLVMARVFNWI